MVLYMVTEFGGYRSHPKVFQPSSSTGGATSHHHLFEDAAPRDFLVGSSPSVFCPASQPEETWEDRIKTNGSFLNRGTPKSSILVGFYITNHLFGRTTIYGNPQVIKTLISQQG